LAASSLSVTGTAGAVEGGELSGWRTTQVGVGANGVAYDTSRDVLYASVPGRDSQHGDEVVAVDPRSGAILDAVWVGGEPRALAVSSDASVLYVGLGAASQIARVDLETFELLEPWALPAGTPPRPDLFAEDIEAQPGNPDVVVVALAAEAISPRSRGVAVFDGGTLRPALSEGHSINSITFGGDDSTVYGFNNEFSTFELTTMALADDGMHTVTVDAGLVGGYGNEIEFSDGRIYSSLGTVIDPVEDTLVGRYAVADAVEPSPVNDRTYVLAGTTLQAFHRTDFTLVDTYELPTSEFRSYFTRFTDLVSTGGGLAARTGEGQLVLLGPALAPRFSDVAGDVHAEAIDLVAQFGIVTGYPDGTYRPGQVITRGQMASFLARALDLEGYGGPPLFTDIAGDVHEPAIGAVAQAGIALGLTDGTFRPRQPVTREQMATFLTRALDLRTDVPAAPFPDATGTHASGIAAIYHAGITQGLPDGTFGASRPVTRGQMATFLVNGLGLRF
jgi:hypothetical protein